MLLIAQPSTLGKYYSLDEQSTFRKALCHTHVPVVYRWLQLVLGSSRFVVVSAGLSAL